MAKKPTAKVSPSKGMTVDAWVKAKTKGWQGEMVNKLLKVARSAAPGAEIAIKWNQPVLVHNGPVAYIKPASAHVTFGFWRGGELDDPEGMLEGSGDRMKHIKLRGPHDARHPAVRGFVRHAASLNRAKGDPTRR